MAVTKCKQLKSYLLGHVLVFRDVFEREYSEYKKSKGKISNDIISTRGTLGVHVDTLRSILEGAWRNTPSGKKFFVSDIKSFEGNIRKELEIAPGVMVRLGDVVRLGNTLGQKGVREHTVVGFHTGRDEIIAAYQEGKFRKKTKHVILDKDFFMKKED